MDVAVITGATSGIGREFVKQIDEKYILDEIWVIARRRERLEEIQGDTKTKVRAIPLDLSLNESIEEYADLLKRLKPNIKLLINASGYGKFGKFQNIGLNEQQGMLSLNCNALMSMTYVSIPFMKRGSQIYQISSISALQPVPGVAVYAATKSFVLSLSRSLSVELKHRGIGVIAVCPFWVKTEFFNRAVTDDTISYYSRYLTADRVVKRAIRDAEKGKNISICGFSNRCQALAVKLLPNSLVMHIWCRQQDIK